MITDSKGNWIDPSAQMLPVFRRDFARSGTLARQALLHTQSPAIQAESLFLLARAEHAEGPSKYIDALEHVRVWCCLWFRSIVSWAGWLAG